MLSDFLRLIKGFVLFIGPSEAGKTSILRRLATGFFEDQDPTLGFREENIAKVRVLEIGGQDSFRKYWQIAVDQKPARIFFVIDVSKNKDFQEYEKFIQDYPSVSNITLLAANKTDLIQAIPNHISPIESAIICSAKTNDGMLEILEAIASMKEKAEYKGQKLPPTSAENKRKPNQNDPEEVESILKEFQGKF
ncbi:MAG: ADP-ribosylation factor-like protein [Candidatus Hodarchaeales archaeon]|jgi:GTPase SAR1 family protein